jgi:hypothetical protein
MINVSILGMKNTKNMRFKFLILPLISLAFFGLASEAKAANEILLNINTISSKAGQEATLVLTQDTFTNSAEAPALYSFRLTYDTADISSFTIRPGASMTAISGKVVSCSIVSAGVYNCQISGALSDVLSDGQIALLVFNVRVGTANKTSNISLSNVTATGATSNNINVISTNGAINVDSAAAPVIFSFNPSSGSGNPGSNVDLNVSVNKTNAAEAPDVLMWDVIFDPAQISGITLVELQAMQDAGVFTTCLQAAAGDYKCSISWGYSAITDNIADIATIRFTISNSASLGNTSVSLTGAIAAGLDYIPTEVSGGTITATAPVGVVPTVSIGSPSASLTKSGPITYTITYTDATAVTLANGNITLNKTGTANGTAVVSGSGTASRTVTISSITGDGTIGISVAAGSSSNAAGSDIGAGPSTTFTADNTAPNNQNSVFSSGTTVIGGASVVIVSSGDATNNVWFAPSGTTSFAIGATMTKVISGTATTILAPATAGSYKLFVIDVAGNISSASTATLTVDNTAPTASITYSDADGIVKQGNSLVITATFSEAITDSPVVKIAISGGDTLAATNMTKTNSTHYTYTRTVGSGNGTATVSLSIGTDIAGNVITSTPTSGATYTVDNIAPTLTISSPSATATTTGSITYTITYTDATAVTLANGNITLNKTGTANGTAVVSGSGTASRTVTISSITGNGTIGISVAASTASDAAGNNSAAAGPSTTFIVDNTAPTAPSSLSATAVSTSEIDLSWTASTDSGGLVGYKIYQCTDASCISTTQIGTVTSGTTYQNTSLSSGTAYFYTISAYDVVANVSATSTSSTATTQTPAPVTTTVPQTSSSGGHGGGGGGGGSVTSASVTATPCTGTSLVDTTPLTKNLSYGSQGADVVSLQKFLASKGYMTADNATGFFGMITQSAVQKFQAAQNIISYGTPISTGYGNVGNLTRTKINSLMSGNTCSTQNTAAIQALIQLLLKQIVALQAQLMAAQAAGL